MSCVSLTLLNKTALGTKRHENYLLHYIPVGLPKAWKYQSLALDYQQPSSKVLCNQVWTEWWFPFTGLYPFETGPFHEPRQFIAKRSLLYCKGWNNQYNSFDFGLCVMFDNCDTILVLHYLPYSVLIRQFVTTWNNSKIRVAGPDAPKILVPIVIARHLHRYRLTN